MAGGGGGTTYQSNIPPFLEGPVKDVVGRGMELTKSGGFTPYSPYASVAPMSQTQMMAGAETRGLGAQARFTPEAADYYMNPYQQSVTNIAKREALREGQMMERDLQDKGAKAGAFGNTRFGVAEGQLRSDLGQRLADIQVKGAEAAYRDAQNMFQRDRDETYRRIAQQQGFGQLERGIQQDLRDRAREQFEDAQDYEFRQLERMRNLISGLPYSTSGRQQTASPSAFQQVAGLGIAGLGAMYGR